MKTHVAICLLLSCISFELIARTSGSFMDAIIKAFNHVTHAGNISMYDHNGELVPITNNQDPNQKYPGSIMFYFHTESNDSHGWKIRVNQPADFKESGFNVSNPTYIITHGWLGTSRSRVCKLIRHAYLTTCDSCNVIVVDWSKYSLSRNYLDVIKKVDDAARTVAEMIKYLYSQGLTWDKITLVGFSLGAHVMGIAGYNVEPKVKQLIGLDPALPGYELAGPGEGFSMKDARNVQIIHTNAGGLGYQCPNGHTDFYPNGGAQQEGCCDEFPNSTHPTLEEEIPAIVECAACSHERAYELFAESLMNTFNATKCSAKEMFHWKSCGQAKPIHFEPMGGIEMNKIERGVYYLQTGAKSPFSVPTRRTTTAVPIHLFPLFINDFCPVSEPEK